MNLDENGVVIGRTMMTMMTTMSVMGIGMEMMMVMLMAMMMVGVDDVVVVVVEGVVLVAVVYGNMTAPSPKLYETQDSRLITACRI